MKANLIMVLYTAVMCVHSLRGDEIDGKVYMALLWDNFILIICSQPCTHLALKTGYNASPGRDTMFLGEEVTTFI